MMQIRNKEAKKRSKSASQIRGAVRQKPQPVSRSFGRMGRVLRTLLLISTASAFTGGFGWVLIPFMGDVINQPIDRVSVEGQFDYLPKEQVQSALQPYIHERFFTVDLSSVQNDLMTIPWIENVRVHRQWPGELDITITEQVAVARWQDEYLLNSHGESFFAGNTEIFPGLAQLSGPDGFELEVMDQYEVLSKILRPLDLSIQNLSVNHRGSWSLQTDKFEIMIGSNHVVDKIQRFVAVYNATLRNSERVISRIDVRYLNGVAVAWKDQPVSNDVAQHVLPNTLGRVKL